MELNLYNVAPSVPAELSFLEELARNLWWSWKPGGVELFRQIDPQGWRESEHNPVLLLSRVPQARLEALVSDDAFRCALDRLKSDFEHEVGRHRADTREACSCVAYFSLEFALHESIRIYSGGLGVLAGDHLKAASDMGLPLVAVGLFYRQGYFRQFLNNDGRQQEHYPDNEIHQFPVTPVIDNDGEQMRVSIPLPGQTLHALVWHLAVGRVSLYLLDTNLHENSPELRRVSDQLYGGDRIMRLRQEIVLGIGGYRALCQMGYHSHVCHINEGHAAFLCLSRIAHLVKDKGLSFEAARETVRRTSVFTTHTPVPAGNEVFHRDIVLPHLEALRSELNIDPNLVLGWGCPPKQHSDELSMTILGLNLCRYSNGVSELHGRVARRMWAHLWPDRPEHEIPLRHITNGVHPASFVASAIASLFDRYAGPKWRGFPIAPEILDAIESIPDEEFWPAHELCRSRMIRTIRERAEQQYEARNATRHNVQEMKTILNHDALTIGFARRFATYKRATLLLRDPERLEALLSDPQRPVQLVFAGKAHPADQFGKDFIQQIVQFSMRPAMRKRVVFVEDYDLHIGRRLVQGVDVWLNNPRRPLEASGTSGMKAALNGAVNVSVLDGWWCEGYSPDCGWAIGNGEEYADHEAQDIIESQTLFNLLENEVVPRFYNRPHGDLPHQWIRTMKASMRMAFSFFTSHRMVNEYRERFYEPAMMDYAALIKNRGELAQRIVDQQKRIETHWDKVRLSCPVAETTVPTYYHVGDAFAVASIVSLGALKPDEVKVQAYYGAVNSEGRIVEGHTAPMSIAEKLDKNRYRYVGNIPCGGTGRFGYTARAIPGGDDCEGLMPGFIQWAKEE